MRGGGISPGGTMIGSSGGGTMIGSAGGSFGGFGGRCDRASGMARPPIF
jgi:hypothetical protein